MASQLLKPRFCGLLGKMRLDREKFAVTESDKQVAQRGAAKNVRRLKLTKL
jgi:hypothetical protein